MARAARQPAQDFVDHLNAVLNRTVTEGRLTLVTHGDVEFDVTSGDSPLKLNGRNLWLSVRQHVRVEGKKIHTLVYRYQLLADAEDPKSAWLMRWDYARHWPANYPWYPSHVHVHGDLKRGAAKQQKDMHIPAERIPLRWWSGISSRNGTSGRSRMTGARICGSRSRASASGERISRERPLAWDAKSTGSVGIAGRRCG